MTNKKEFYLDLSNLKRLPLEAKGSKFLESKIIDFSEILVATSTDKSINLARLGGNVDQNHVNKLALSHSAKFDGTEQPPIVQRGKFIDSQGKIYKYRLITGNHTLSAFKKLNRTKAIFDIYVFGLDKISELRSISNLQAVENNKNPQKGSSIDDLIYLLCNLIQEKELNNNQKDVEDFLNEKCDTSHHTQKQKITLEVIRKQKGYQDIKTYTAHEVLDFININTNYKAGGTFDHQRNKIGWSVLEGYMYEFITSAILKYDETNKESYFLCHTRQPTASNNLNQKRFKEISTLDRFNNSLLKIIDFYNENKRFPWTIEGFLPQDRKNKEDTYTIISPSQVVLNYKKDCNFKYDKNEINVTVETTTDE